MYLFIYINMDSYIPVLFIGLQSAHFFNAQSIPDLVKWEALQDSFYALLICSIILQVPSYFLAQYDVPGSSCTFPAVALESASSPKSPDFF